MPQQEISLTPDDPDLDLTHVWDNPNIEEAQKAHDALEPHIRQKLTQALQKHLESEASPLQAIPQDQFNADQMDQKEAISNIASGAPPNTTQPKQKLLSAQPDFSTL